MSLAGALLALFYEVANVYGFDYAFTSPDIRKGSGISIRVESAYDQVPRVGFLPIRIILENKSDRARDWLFHFTSSSSQGRSDYLINVNVEASKIRQRYAYVPLATLNRDNNARLEYRVSGYGVINRAYIPDGELNITYHSDERTQFLLMSRKFGSLYHSQVEEAIKSNSETYSYHEDYEPIPPRKTLFKGKKRWLDAQVVDLEQLPADPRIWMGVQSLWLYQSDWMKLSNAQRSTILDWVWTGGIAYVEINTKELYLDGVGPVEDRKGVGFGEIRLVEVELVNKANWIKDAILDMDSEVYVPVADDYHEGWNLLDLVRAPGISIWFVVAFVVLFGLLIGPFNIWVIAPNRRRVRLFLTIPLISLAGGLIITLVILISEGTGGFGRRFTLVALLPDRPLHWIVQEQVSRTSLLLSRSFEVDPETQMMALKKKYWKSDQDFYQRSAQFLEGDWFSSRKTQRHIIQQFQPTRARLSTRSKKYAELEIREVISRLDLELEDVWIIDEDDEYWHCKKLSRGQWVELEKQDAVAYQNWWADAIDDASLRMRAYLNGVRHKKGYFYALAKANEEIPLSTLDSIDWQDDRIIYLGEWVEDEL